MPLQIIRQDITKIRVDAIVNTTNEEMVGYSGVDLAVHEGAGRCSMRSVPSLLLLVLAQPKSPRDITLMPNTSSIPRDPYGKVDLLVKVSSLNLATSSL